MVKAEYFRICGYIVTLTMHTVNSILCKLRGQDSSALEDPGVKRLMAMEATFFTVWNIAFQIAYSIIGLYCDIKTLQDGKDKKKWSKYLKYRKVAYSILIWPCAWFVCTAFWPLFLYDRSVIFPEFVDKVVSKTGNLIIHAFIVPVVVWELFFLPVETPKSHKKNISCLLGLMVCYLSWIFYIRFYTIKMWPYPILELLEGTIYFPFFFMGCFALVTVHYYSQWSIRLLISSTSTKKVNKSS